MAMAAGSPESGYTSSNQATATNSTAAGQNANSQTGPPLLIGRSSSPIREPTRQRPPWIDSRVEVAQKRPQKWHHEPEVDPEQHRADVARTQFVSTASERC